jgi:tetratricopeptide (TPR) repeat protein
MKRLVVRGLSALFLCGFLGVAALTLLVQTDETWARRLAYVPRLAETTLRRLRPVAELPTPPPASADSRARLLALTPLAPPTLPPPAVEVIGAPQSRPALGPTPTLAPTPSPAPLVAAAQTASDQLALTGVQHAYQTWNNCGPVTIAMNLSYYEHYRDQQEAAAFLKPDEDDKNVSPEQIVAYARQQGFDGLVRVGGTTALLQQLLSNGIPVIVEDWVDPEDRGGIGHYRLFTGYDRAAGHFIAQDSLYGPDRVIDMESFDASWRVFNRKYIVIFRPEAADSVRGLLGTMAGDEAMLAHTVAVARAEAETDPNDYVAWFNLGSAYTLLGDYELAATAYDEARRAGLPFRMLWYQEEPFAAYLGAGRHRDVIRLAEVTLLNAGDHEEA